jgi:MoaA/NifB/PqqE/SkfB family radical SAM enzyme
MQALTQVFPETDRPGKLSQKIAEQINIPTGGYFIQGFRLKVIRFLIWTNIFLITLKEFINPITALRKVRELKKIRNQYRNQQILHRFFKCGHRYFVNFNTPGWPSLAFNRYIRHMLNRKTENGSPSLNTFVFAITKKCGFQCEHCCEWLNLNKPESLSKEDLLTILKRFYQLGVAQVQLSGGEPLNRLNDIFYLLDNAPPGIDFWLYTSGFNLTKSKAIRLKQHGLTGITISLDHYLEEKHDAFRGIKNSWGRVLQAARFARSSGLLVCFSLCTTREFVNIENLSAYLKLAKENNVAFIQILEPKAVGHYAGLDVQLKQTHFEILEKFVETNNYTASNKDFPVITYHGYQSRRFGCSGTGVDYVYVDTDGDVHNCPFCQRKLFSAMDSFFQENIRQMKSQGCSVYKSGSS